MIIRRKTVAGESLYYLCLRSDGQSLGHLRSLLKIYCLNLDDGYLAIEDGIPEIQISLREIKFKNNIKNVEKLYRAFMRAQETEAKSTSSFDL